jgi:hypothetical protein
MASPHSPSLGLVGLLTDNFNNVTSLIRRPSAGPDPKSQPPASSAPTTTARDQAKRRRWTRTKHAEPPRDRDAPSARAPSDSQLPSNAFAPTYSAPRRPPPPGRRKQRSRRRPPTAGFLPSTCGWADRLAGGRTVSPRGSSAPQRTSSSTVHSCYAVAGRSRPCLMNRLAGE